MRWLFVVLAGLCLNGVAVDAVGMDGIDATGFDAAMPILEAGMTRVTASSDLSSVGLSVERAITSHVSLTGVADSNGTLDLRLRLLAPWELAPAFLAVEFSPTRVTGLMTIYFGPVSIDLERSWFNPMRSAVVQWVVVPRWTLVLSATERFGEITPAIGCRLFPEASGEWEIGALVSPRGISVWMGGVL